PASAPKRAASPPLPAPNYPSSGPPSSPARSALCYRTLRASRPSTAAHSRSSAAQNTPPPNNPAILVAVLEIPATNSPHHLPTSRPPLIRPQAHSLLDVTLVLSHGVVPHFR